MTDFESTVVIKPNKISVMDCFKTLRPRQEGRHFPDDILKCIFLDENVLIVIKMSLKFVPKGPINNIPALVQTMAWQQPGDKPLSGPMMVTLLTYMRQSASMSQLNNGAFRNVFKLNVLTWVIKFQRTKVDV